MHEIAHRTIPTRFGIDLGKMGLSTSIFLGLYKYISTWRYEIDSGYGTGVNFAH